MSSTRDARRKMQVLELFCGTKSIGKAVHELYPDAQIISLDIEAKFNPDICISLLDWNYKEYPSGHFDYIHASPPCTSYTWLTHKHRHGAEGDYRPKTDVGVLGDNLVKKTLEILNYFKPRFWTVENPRGRLRHMTHMRTLVNQVVPIMKTVYYCQYGMPYPKATDIWSNLDIPFTGLKCTHRPLKHERKVQHTKYLDKIAIPHVLCTEFLKCLVI